MARLSIGRLTRVTVKAVYRFLAKNIAFTLQFLQLVSIIVGAIYFLVQYHNNNVMDRKKETLKYVDKSLDKELGNMLLDLDRPFQNASLKPEIDAAMDKGYATGDICPVKEFYQKTFLSSYFKSDQERAQFFSQLSSRIRAFETIAVCVNSQTCDLDTACAYFFDDAKTLVTDHCVEFDRYKLQFGYSPARETEKFLAACNASDGFPRRYASLTYCEGIEKIAAAKLPSSAKLSPRDLLAKVYEKCPFTAEASNAGSRKK